jgi:hypothetical protein
MSENTNTYLQAAKSNRDDEFYTTLECIEKELTHYHAQLSGKTILCNCDNPFVSNFCRYFIIHFREIGIKRLICSSYASSPMFIRRISLIGVPDDVQAYALDVDEDNYDDFMSVWSHSDKDSILKSGYVYALNGNGSFDSDECIDLLEKSDVVITNPPFSMFRDFISLLEGYDKKYLVIGNQNALMYKEIFPLVKDNKAWLGYNNGDMSFRVPDDTEPRKTRYWVDSTGQKWRSLGNAMWFTNLDVDRRHERIVLENSYNENDHPQFDNYEAIYVSKVSDIPKDFWGVMAVPLTILGKYNPNQFEIIGEANHGSDNPFDLFKPILNGKAVYKRILVRRVS